MKQSQGRRSRRRRGGRVELHTREVLTVIEPPGSTGGEYSKITLISHQEFNVKISDKKKGKSRKYK